MTARYSEAPDPYDTYACDQSGVPELERAKKIGICRWGHKRTKAGVEHDICYQCRRLTGTYYERSSMVLW